MEGDVRVEIEGLDDASPFLTIRHVCARCGATVTSRRFDTRVDDGRSAMVAATADALRLHEDYRTHMAAAHPPAAEEGP